jgi:hypothetical protein
MSFNVDSKLIFSVVAFVVTFIAYFFYVKDIFLHKTKPHTYTWWIWIITTSIAALGIWEGGGKFGLFGILATLIAIVFISILSIRYGTKDVTRLDSFILVLALFSVFVWWKLDELWLSVVMVSMIDILAYIPTYRKSFKCPCQETVIFWIGLAMANLFTFLALSEYNLLTVLYVGMLFVAHLFLGGVLVLRKGKLKKRC